MDETHLLYRGDTQFEIFRAGFSHGPAPQERQLDRDNFSKHDDRG